MMCRIAHFVVLSFGMIALAISPVVAGGKIHKPKKAEKPFIAQDKLAVTDARDKVMQQSYHKLYARKMTPGTTYIITLVTNRFDAYLRLEDPNGKQLAVDDDGAGQLNSKIVYTPTKAGKYRVIATSLGGNSTGPFTLTITPLGKKKQLLNVNGKLTAGDPYDVVRRSSRHKVFNVEMTAGKTYSILMTSNRLNGYLRVEDFRGNQRAIGNRAGRNVSLQFTPLVSDNHRIIVTTLTSNQTGDFQLVVNQQ